MKPALRSGRPPQAPRRRRSSRRAARLLTSQASHTATEAKNVFGQLLDPASHGEPVVITKHDAPRAVLISIDQFTALKRAPEAKLDTLSRQFDQLLDRMQSKKARAAADALFHASPQALGRVALAAARKRG